MFDLSKHHIPNSQEAFYIPNFVSEDEEQYLIRKILDSPRQKWKQLANRRLQIWGGEITAHNVLFPQDMPSFIDKFPDLILRLSETGAFRSSPHGAPNHVILNEYLAGQGIMPHEDGPSYHPLVATISLGSHTVFHYYRYKDEDDSSKPAGASINDGHAIDPTPILTVFLEPRSAIITTSSLYTSHLHGIQEIPEDHINSENGTCAFAQPGIASRVKIANWGMLAGPAIERIVKDGASLARGTRYSLTCRDVARVTSTKLFLRK